MRNTAGLALCALLLALPVRAEPEPQGADAERLRTAKELFFDRKYVEARTAWSAVLAHSQGAQAATAAGMKLTPENVAIDDGLKKKSA